MLDCEFSPADNSFVQDFLMDPMPLCASQLNVDDQASFGTYTAFLSEAYPFFIPQSFAPDISHPHSKGQAYPDPSESSIIASQSELLSSASSISTRSVGSVTSSCIGSPKQELWTDMNPVSSFDQHATLNARSRFQDYSSTEFSADSQSVQDKISNCFVGK